MGLKRYLIIFSLEIFIKKSFSKFFENFKGCYE